MTRAGDLEAAVDALDLAVARGAELVDPGLVEAPARLAAAARTRIGFLGDTVLVALAGGTGSGKSSMLNALAGEKVALTGPHRPTTDLPLAWIPDPPEPGLVRFLDELGVEQRVLQTQMPGVAVLDLPDLDSIEPSHLLAVERLVPRVDAVIWVLDPEKYGDEALHGRWLAPLAGYARQFVVVLNQMDRLPPGAVETVLADLRRMLATDGITDPVLLATAADPPEQEPVVAALTEVLEARVAGKETATATLVTDLRRAGAGLAAVTGVTAAGLDLDRRWTAAREATASALAAAVVDVTVVDAAERDGVRQAVSLGSGPIGRLAHAVGKSPVGRALGAGRDEAGETVVQRAAAGAGLPAAAAALEKVVGDLSFEAGGAFGARLRADFSPQRVESELEAAADAVLARQRDPGVAAPSGWLRVAAVVQTLVLIAIIGAIAWVWARPDTLRPGSWPWPVLVTIGAAALGWGTAKWVRDAGRRAGRRAALARRRALAAELSGELDRRLGQPLRARARDRAELAGLLAELAAATARIDHRLSAPASR